MDYFFIIKKVIFIVFLVFVFGIICKLGIFYIPFIIAYIISLIVDPVIKWINRKTNISRKASSIIVLATIFLLLAGIIIFGGIKLISEATNLLGGLNTYLDKSMKFINDVKEKINIDSLNLSPEVIGTFEKSTTEFINSIIEYIKNILTKILN